MNSNEKQQQKDAVMKIMEMMTEEYPGKFSLSETRIKIWCQMLSDLHPEHILAAGYHLVSVGSEWPPAIGTVRLTAKRIAHGNVNPPSALESWERVQQKIQRKEIELTPLEKKALSRVGTMWDLRHSENQSFDRSNFIKSFEEILRTDERELVTMPNVMALSRASESPGLYKNGDAVRHLDELTGNVGAIEE